MEEVSTTTSTQSGNSRNKAGSQRLQNEKQPRIATAGTNRGWVTTNTVSEGIHQMSTRDISAFVRVSMTEIIRPLTPRMNDIEAMSKNDS